MKYRRLRVWTWHDIVALKHLCFGLWYIVRSLALSKDRDPGAARPRDPIAALFQDERERLFRVGLQHLDEFEKM